MSNESQSMTVPDRTGGELSEVMIDWNALNDGVPDQYQDWMPFLVFGLPYIKIADIFGVSKSTVTKAITNHPALGRAISLGRKMVKRQLHYVWLDQKAVTAWKQLDGFLDLDPFEKNEKGKFIHDTATRRTLLVEKGKMVRFVLTQLGLHVQRVEVRHDAPPPMFLGDASLAEHVVQRITEVADQKAGIDVIEAEYSSIDENTKPFGMDKEEKEMKASYDISRTDATKFGGLGSE